MFYQFLVSYTTRSSTRGVEVEGLEASPQCGVDPTFPTFKGIGNRRPGESVQSFFYAVDMDVMM
jgi:hypothetical protein